MTYILSWDIKKMFQTINKMTESNNKDLIEWVGTDCWDKLVAESNGDTNAAIEWVRYVFKGNIKETCVLLQTITNETQDNPKVQARLKAVGFTPNK